MPLAIKRGFTLIELVIVIIILSILAATALPRFIDLTSDTNDAALKGLANATQSAANFVYAKALIQGVVNEADGEVDIDNNGITDITTVYGYPSADRTTGIANALDLGEDWAYGDNKPSSNLEFYATTAARAGFSGVTNNNIPIKGANNCYLIYTAPQAAGDSPQISFVTSEC